MVDKIMRILFVSDLFPPNSKGGYELRCAETANEIAARGHTVFVLTGKVPSLETKKGENIYRLLTLSSIKSETFPNITAIFRRVKRRASQLSWAVQCRKNYAITRDLVKELKPDIGFIWNMECLDVAPILAIQDQGIPTAYSLGAYWLLFLKNELDLEPNVLKRRFRGMILGLNEFSSINTSNMLAVSSALKKSYVEKGFSDQDITVIPRGISSKLILDSNTCYEANLPKKNKLLFVGRLTPDKAPDTAIRAIECLVKRYGDNEIKLNLIGTGTEQYLMELKKLVKDLHIERNIQFLGSHAHKDVLNLYLEHDYLIFPSRWEEPLGGIILEAMARGLPVIATNRGGMPEIISDGENGLIVPADNPEALAEAINRLRKDPKLAHDIRLAAFDTIREKYTLEMVTDQIIEYLETVIDRDKDTKATRN